MIKVADAALADTISSGCDVEDYEDLLAAWLAQPAGDPEPVGDSDSCPAAKEEALPAIIVTNRPARAYIEEARLALQSAQASCTLYKRAGRIVVVVAGDDGRMGVQMVGTADLALSLSQAADFYRKGSNGLEHIAPPPLVINNLLARPDLDLPVLMGITESPVLRPDGSILQEPGYDQSTRLFYHPAPGLNSISLPDSPSIDEVQSAMALVEEVLCDFPFEDAASKANAMGLLLTPIVRPMIETCVPMAVINGTCPGIGKGLLASVVVMIASGSNAIVETAPSGEDELRKKITALLAAGRTFVIWDNLRGKLESTSLEAALTATTWSDRILGATQNQCFPQRAIWIATGNNVRLGTDLMRRCFDIRLLAHCARPWQQNSFKHTPLISWVAERRRDLLSALLTMARAWVMAGRPKPSGQPLGSFEQWSEVVGGILEYAHIPGFLGNLEVMYAGADDDNAEWAGFLESLRNRYHSQPFTVCEVVSAMTGTSSAAADLKATLPTALFDLKEETLRRALGRAFAKRLGTPFGSDGLCVRKDGVAHTKAVKWRVSSVEEEHPGPEDIFA